MMPTVRPGGTPHCRTCHAEPGGSLLSGKVLMTALHVVRALSGTLTPKAHLTFGCSLASWPCVYLDGVSWSLSRNLYQPVGWAWNLQVQNSVLTAIDLERQI